MATAVTTTRSRYKKQLKVLANRCSLNLQEVLQELTKPDPEPENEAYVALDGR